MGKPIGWFEIPGHVDGIPIYWPPTPAHIPMYIGWEFGI